MIDRIARDKFAELLRHLTAGQISNDEFENRLPLKSKDPAVNKIFWHGAWALYSDMSTYKLIGECRLSKSSRRDVARWILFLKSDLEYEWPFWRSLHFFPGYLLIVLSFGLLIPIAKRRLTKCGDQEVWPFIRKSDFEHALANPPYLN